MGQIKGNDHSNIDWSSVEHSYITCVKGENQANVAKNKLNVI